MDYALLGTGDIWDAIGLVKTYGPFLLAVLFFLWRDWKREDRLTNRIDILEDEMRSVILPLVKECSAVIANNTLVMQRLEKIIEH